jgi:glycerol kinase
LRVVRDNNVEATATGAAYLAGLGIGMWTKDTLQKRAVDTREFEPKMSQDIREKLYNGWLNAVKRTLNWLDD